MDNSELILEKLDELLVMIEDLKETVDELEEKVLDLGLPGSGFHDEEG